jgi:N4-gp56 family major capsid protein
MALTAVDTGTYSPHPVNALMEQAFLRRAQQVCPYFAGTQPGQMATNAGTATVKWRRFEQETPTTSALTEISTAAYGNSRNADTPTNTDVTALVAKYGQFYILTEEVDLLSVSGTALELMDILGESAGRSLNMLMRNVMEDSSTQVYAANVASTGAVHAAVAIGDLDFILNTLTRNSARTFSPLSNGSVNIGTVPILSSYWGICHPDVAYNITTITGFNSVEKYAGQVALVEGEFGFYGRAGRGIRFVMSEDSSVDANAGAALSGADLRSTGGSVIDIYTTVIYGQNAYGSVGLGKRHTDGVYRAGDNTGGWELISHPKGSAGTGDPFNEISTIAWKAWYAGAVLNANWGRALRSGATRLDN